MTGAFQAKKINIDYFWIAPYFFVLSVLYFGERLIPACLLVTAVSIVINFCCVRLVTFIAKRRAREFLLNDDEQKIITKKYAIPYNKIKTINIFKTTSSLSIYAVLSDFVAKKIWLLSTDIKDEENVVAEIKKRFNDEKIKICKITRKREHIIWLIIILSLLLQTLYLYQKLPQLKIFPKQYLQKSEATDAKEINPYNYNGFNFNLPKTFSQKKVKDKIIFYPEDHKTVVGVKKQSAIDKLIYKYLSFPFVGEYGLYRILYNSRLGTHTLRKKALLLTIEGSTLEIYEINNTSVKGFLVVKEDKEYIKTGSKLCSMLKLELFLMDKNTHSIIKFDIWGQDRTADLKLSDMLINGISRKK